MTPLLKLDRVNVELTMKETESHKRKHTHTRILIGIALEL